MINLLKLLERLQASSFSDSYFIPKLWNSFNFKNYKFDSRFPNEINVNPYEFISHCIEHHVLRKSTNKNYLEPLNLHNEFKPNLSKSTIYGMLPRMFSSWDHKKTGEVSSGTFLKSICLLPFLKELGVDILYLLPIFKYSDKHKKSEIGSPYSIKNLYQIDPNLHDDLLGEYSEDLLNLEFKAFVEACHILDIQVMIDFVFRSCSRDNDFIIEHPEWFYWIDKKYNDDFSVPYVSSEKELTLLDNNSLLSLYAEKETEEYISKFTYDPKTINEKLWLEVLTQHENTGENILDLIEKTFKITTVPGFPDVINDVQPPWTDVTYFKLYFDLNKQVQKLVKKDHPPYILNDGIKANLFPGEIKNQRLWDYISDVIPFYQRNFGIDGARIDMAHALPKELNIDIISKAKDNNPNFILWSEEFHSDKSAIAKDDGFDFISGLLWGTYPKLNSESFNTELFDSLIESKIPVAAAPETPDTPRISWIHQNKKVLEMIILMNSFLPNSVPFINNGLELLEIQPMNLGLGNTEDGKFVLPKDDPMYGKLAFFDNYQLHWLDENSEYSINLIQKANSLRQKYIDLISIKENFTYNSKFNEKNKFLTLISYFNKNSNEFLFLLANRDIDSDINVPLAKILPKKLLNTNAKIKLIYPDIDTENNIYSLDSIIKINALELVIGILDNY